MLTWADAIREAAAAAVAAAAATRTGNTGRRTREE